MKKILMITVRYMCGAILFAGSAQALGGEPTIVDSLPSELIDTEDQSEKYLPAGLRNFSEDKSAGLQEEQQEAEDQEKEGQEIKDLISQTETEPAQGAMPNVNLAKAAVNATPIFYTSHPGAFHFPVLIGGTVKLEDGSIWAINSDDSYKTLNWLATDAIVIAPNTRWFSSYKFRLTNQNTMVAVEANLQLFLTPYYHSIYNHQIVLIDDLLEMIWLEDGSVWSIASADYSRKWQISDTVIIGINDGKLSSSKPNILINANLLQTARANCIGY